MPDADEARAAVQAALANVFEAMAVCEAAGLDPAEEILSAITQAAEAAGVELPPMLSMFT